MSGRIPVSVRSLTRPLTPDETVPPQKTAAENQSGERSEKKRSVPGKGDGIAGGGKSGVFSVFYH